MDNGIVKLRLINPTGLIKGISYNEVGNVLERSFKESQRGLECSKFRIIAKSDDKIEVSFIKTWNVSLGENVVPLHIDKRYIMLRGVSGFYSYAIYEHLEKWPDLNIDETRIAFKLDQNIFNYMAISEHKQRIMPTSKDRDAGKILGYKEAVLLTNTSDPRLKGEVDAIDDL
ncbi:hypothetical protein C2S52_009467 [Perilla frutescens var. hirtella]|nr:hypothetical protein C2S52_009467 [Perilla frutescens var. hirtella]